MWESVLSFDHWGSRKQTQVLRLRSKCLYPQSHPTGPLLFLKQNSYVSLALSMGREFGPGIKLSSRTNSFKLLKLTLLICILAKRSGSARNKRGPVST